MRNRLLPSAALSLALLWAPPAPAQPPETGGLGGLLPPPEPNVVTVDVAVTTDEGGPLPGLTAEDFEVFDDGAPVPGPRLAAPEPAHLVLLLDDTRLSPAQRSTAVAEARRQLESLMAAADRILVARQNREIRIEQPFTSDRAQVENALERLEKTPSGVASEASAERALLEEIRLGQAPSSNTLGPGPASDEDPLRSAESTGVATLAAVRQVAGQQRARGLRNLASLGDLAAALSELPGRKAVLLLSGGVDLRPGEPLFRAWIERYRSIAAATSGGSVELELPSYQIDRELQDLIAAAGADRVVFYTLDPSGGGTGLPSGERRPRGVSAALPSGPSGEESLRRLAEESGGAFSPLPEGLGRLAERIAVDLRLPYRLTFPSPHGGDGAQHTVEVRVRRPGARARHALRYRDETPDERLRDRASSALLLGMAANPLDIQVELGEPSKERGDASTVPVTVKIPLARLALLPRGDSHQGQVSILILLQDGQGALSAVPKLSVPIQIPNRQIVDSMARIGTWGTSLRLRGGEQRLAVAVRDEVGGVDAALALPIELPSPQDKGRRRGR